MAEIKSMKKDLRKVKRRTIGITRLESSIGGLEKYIDTRIVDCFTAREKGLSVAKRLKKLSRHNGRKRQSRNRRLRQPEVTFGEDESV